MSILKEKRINNGESSDMKKMPWMQKRTLSSRDLILPLLVTEDKREANNDNQAMNQCISNCVAAVTFLHDVVRIADFPVWGICAKGVLCRTIMVWMSSENKAKNGDPETFVLETGTQTYDMKDPVDAINFAIFLLKLRNEASVELERRFDEGLCHSHIGI
ncbi:hypothetical protein C8Q75DRAFT_370387 [Abortiporus biennis]|nr:hypothetical protein C8Q75DRAFT_370387 [Abortiporus biennis]